MPPAWSPEKRNANHYAASEQEVNPEPGYLTPPRNPTNDTNVRRCSEREERHMQWLLQKLPKLSSIFRLHRQIGEGTFSAVFMASLLNDYEQNKLFAIKHLVPTTHPVRIEVELRCLQLIGGQDNVVGIDLCMRENENIIFVMPYLQHQPFIEYVHNMGAKETATYMKNLLLAVCRVHKFGIIHRDIKPNNFLYDRCNKKYLLVDFGLAQVSSTSSPPKTFEAPKATLPQKRKRENDIAADMLKAEVCEPAAKRPALQKRNLNSLNYTVSQLQNSFAKNPLPLPATKENVLGIIQSVAMKSPFKSPMKNVSKQVLKSPYKFNGLDLPPTHSKFSCAPKMLAQRKLFTDNDEVAKPKFQKPISSMSVTTRNPGKNISPSQIKSKQIQQNLSQDCKCFNKASVCSVCLLRKAQDAPRAGTPGFRPPEVLLKYSKQTTAVDIWAVGIIMLCILSGTFPFFRAPDDTTALAELITLFGDEQIKKLARLFGRQLICSEKKPPLDLRKVCCKLRSRGKQSEFTSDKKCKNCEQFIHNCLCIGTPIIGAVDIFPDSAYDLLKRLLDVDPYKRISAEEALKHPFLNEF
ncbi:Cdc7 kinase [Carabus blaptoides fortunei]